MGLKKNRDNITPALSRIQRQLQNVPAQTHKYFVSVTPKDTGNARTKTKLVGNTIEANYPYAQRLDKGWSKQSPRGMIEPTKKFLERLLRRIVRK